MQRSVIIACVYLSCAYVPVHAIDLAIGTEVLSCMCYHCNNSLKPSYSILIHMHTHTQNVPDLVVIVTAPQKDGFLLPII